MGYVGIFAGCASNARAYIRGRKYLAHLRSWGAWSAIKTSYSPCLATLAKLDALYHIVREWALSLNLRPVTL